MPVGLALAAGLLLSPPPGEPFSETPQSAEGELSDQPLSPAEFFAQGRGDAEEEAPSTPEPAPSATQDPAGSASTEANGEETDTETDDADEEPVEEDEDSASPEPPGGSGGGGSTSNPRAQEVVDLTNDERAAAGCGPLRVDNSLTAAAQAHSEDMAARNYMAHESPEGVGPMERAQAEGYPAFSGENVAAGQGSPQAVVNAWMNSEGHRANILNCDNQAIGVGEEDRYWTQMFGRE